MNESGAFLRLYKTVALDKNYTARYDLGSRGEKAFEIATAATQIIQEKKSRPTGKGRRGRSKSDPKPPQSS